MNFSKLYNDFAAMTTKSKNSRQGFNFSTFITSERTPNTGTNRTSEPKPKKGLDRLD